MVHMSHAYLTKKQMWRIFWYYAIKHSVWMMNMIPGKYHWELALPFMLVHGVCLDWRTCWLPLFSLCHFHHEKNSGASHSKSQAHTMDGILLGPWPTSNAILIYNPRNQNYYEPDSYCLDPYPLPSSVYPTIRYNGGLFVSLHWDGTAAISKQSNPGHAWKNLSYFGIDTCQDGHGHPIWPIIFATISYYVRRRYNLFCLVSRHAFSDP